jgi:glucosyl-dolichyl phosphate glucuronosyltransferase
MMVPKISVVVCTYNGENVLDECLASLTKQSLSTDKYEVLIIDNNSTDNSAKIAAKFIRRNVNFHIYSEENIGLSYARNRGIQESKGKYIAYIDDDGKASSNWCSKIIEAFENIQPQPISVGGKILPYYTATEKPSWFDDELEVRTWGERAHFLSNNEVYFSGSNMSYPKHILEENDGFDPKFGVVGENFGLGEESDLYDRLASASLDKFWYDPEIYVYHLVPPEKMSINGRLNRSRISGKYNFLMNNKKKYQLLFDCSLKLSYHMFKVLLLLLRFRIDYKVIYSLQRISSTWTTIKFTLGLLKS